MSLTSVSARYRAASEVVVERHAVEWPAMRAAVGIIRDLRRKTADGVSFALEELIDSLSGWVRVMATAPASPEALKVSAAGLSEALRTHAEHGADIGLGRDLRRLADLLDEVAAGSHPGGSCLEGIICRYGRHSPDDPPAVYVASQRGDVGAIERWLADEELDAEVRSLSELRAADIRDAIILLGSPARYLSSPWCPPNRAARLTGWVLTAPPAHFVHVITWPGHGHLDIDSAPLFPVTVSPKVQMRVRPHSTEKLTVRAGHDDADDAVWLPPTPVERRITPVSTWAGDRDPVSAIGFRLADDRTVFYSPDAEPKPEAVTWDVTSVDLRTLKPGRVRVGQALLFRPLRTATDEELYRRADARLAERCGPGAPAAAHQAKAELKEALARARRGDEELLQYQLMTKLNDATYARHVLHSIPRPGYIAPEKPGAYAAVRSVLGLSPDEGGERYRLLSALRSACRRAGMEITDELIDVLRSTSTWQEELEASGVATVTGGALLGHLELRVVTAIDPTPRRIGRSRIGRLVFAPARARPIPPDGSGDGE